MIHQLKPGVDVPNRGTLAGPLPDELYEAEKKSKEKIIDRNAILALDGWSTISNEPFIGISITTRTGLFLINTIDTTGHPHTAE